jgi:hypothetical protein
VKGFEPPLRRKNSIGNLLKKAQDLYQGQDVMMISQDEFCKDIHFLFGVPLLVLDVFENLTGSKIIPRLRDSVYVPQTVTYVDQYDEDIMIMKGHICDDFYPNCILPMFMDLGAYNFKDPKLVVNTTIEQMQYLTLPSIQ